MMMHVEQIALIVKLNLKTLMLKSSLCDYSDTYLLVNGTITVKDLAVGRGNNSIELAFKNCAPFTECISKINNHK